MILLDTDSLSWLMRPQPPERLLQNLGATPSAEQSTSSITLGEIAYGAAKIGRPELLDRALALTVGLHFFDFDLAAAQAYGRLRALLEKKGKRLDDPDLRIASIAVANGLTLVSGNLKHFRRIPDLDVVDWIHA